MLCSAALLLSLLDVPWSPALGFIKVLPAEASPIVNVDLCVSHSCFELLHNLHGLLSKTQC